MSESESADSRYKVAEVCRLADVERALLTYAATGERDGGLAWRDVTAEMVNDSRRRTDDDGEIGLIQPA